MNLSAFKQQPAVRRFRSIVGLESNTTGHLEKLISGLGAFLGILAVVVTSSLAMGGTPNLLVVASMGASAVLIFAVPHGPLSQPWAVWGSHTLAALIGVTCARWVPHMLLAAALAVGVSVSAMYFARCIHPPGGATALAAVIGGPAVTHLGYGYLLNPVWFNVAALFTVGVLFNALFPWRRYPHHFSRAKRVNIDTADEAGVSLTHEDFAYAISHMKSFVDVSTDVLSELFEHAVQHSEKEGLHPQTLTVGSFYSNGQVGYRWCVRELLDMSLVTPYKDSATQQVIYKNVAGANLYDTGLSSAEAFKRWARYEVLKKDGHWIPVAQPGHH